MYVSYSAGPPYLLERSDMVRVVNTWTTFVPRYDISDIYSVINIHVYRATYTMYIMSCMYIIVTCIFSVLCMFTCA